METLEESSDAEAGDVLACANAPPSPVHLGIPCERGLPLFAFMLACQSATIWAYFPHAPRGIGRVSESCRQKTRECVRMRGCYWSSWADSAFNALKFADSCFVIRIYS